MSTRCNIEFYDDYEYPVTPGVPGTWNCTCEDQTYSKGPQNLVCDHIVSMRYLNRSVHSFSQNVPSRSRPGKTHTVTYTAPEVKSVQRLSARLYQHSDGYPDGMIPQLRQLENKVSGKGQTNSTYGARTNDPEWCAAEFINIFRTAGGGNIYVSQHRHGDIAYLYKVYCYNTGFHIEIYTAGSHRFTDVTNKYHPLTGHEISKNSIREY